MFIIVKTFAMQKIFLIGLFFFYVLQDTVHAQNNSYPDYNLISTEIEDEDSPFYYPVILSKYFDGTESLTLEEKRHLYYGWVFQPEYNPINDAEAFDDFIDSYQGLNDASFFNTNILNTITAILDESPFHLQALFYYLHITNKPGMEEEHNLTEKKIQIVLDAILSSGDGLSENSPIYIINPEHKYFTLNPLNFDYDGQVEILGIIESNQVSSGTDIQRLYFNRKPYFDFTSS